MFVPRTSLFHGENIVGITKFCHFSQAMVLGSVYIFGKLCTYPSPKPLLTRASHQGQSVGLGRGRCVVSQKRIMILDLFNTTSINLWLQWESNNFKFTEGLGHISSTGFCFISVAIIGGATFKVAACRLPWIPPCAFLDS